MTENSEEFREMIGVAVGIACIIPMVLGTVIRFLLGFLDEAPWQSDEVAQWEQNVREMKIQYDLGHDWKVREIRDSMHDMPVGHKPSAEAEEILKEIGKYSGVW